MRYNNRSMTFSERFHDVNWSRKFWHVSGGLIAITIAYLLPWPIPFFVAFATFLWWVSVESMRRREPWFGRLFFSLSAPFVRARERRNVIGNTWSALAMTIIGGLFQDPILLAGSMIGWTFGDPVAEIFGKLIPSTSFFDREKSIAGSLGCFLASAVAYGAFFWIIGTGGDPLSAALTLAATTTLAEAFSTSFTVNDNFMIPLSSALALSYVLV